MRRHRRDGAWVGFSGVVRLVAACLLLAVWSAVADDMRLFRIGTGGEGGTYYPIGGLIARSISQPPGANSCDDPDLCGVSGLVAVAQTANGSVANVRSVAGGRLESGFAQSDVAHWAFTGRGVFADAAPLDNLRAIAALYPETVHVVARREAGIRSVRDLRVAGRAGFGNPDRRPPGAPGPWTVRGRHIARVHQAYACQRQDAPW
jgi:TRAP transporter TAXI family solute receptor